MTFVYTGVVIALLGVVVQWWSQIQVNRAVGAWIKEAENRLKELEAKDE